jgi:magnesium transporter
MPELAWEYGFAATIVLTAFAALLPLLYIKKKGWLR